MIPLEQLLRVPTIDASTAPTICPIRQTIAFAWNASGQWEIYEVPLSAARDPVCLRIPGEGQDLVGAKFSPRYAPDGQRLAYVLDPDGSESYQLVVHDLVHQSAINLTPAIKHALQPNFAWSPDGARLAYISNEDGCFSVYVMPAGGGPGQRIFGNQDPAWAVAWSPDGQYLAIETAGRGLECNIYLVAIEGGSVAPIAIEGELLDAREPAWSPDSKRLAFTASHSDVSEIGLIELTPLKSGNASDPQWLEHPLLHQQSIEHRERSQPAWAPDGKRLAFIETCGAQTRLIVQALPDSLISAHEAQSAPLPEPGCCQHPIFTPDGECLLFLFESPCRPIDLWHWNMSRGECRPITNSLPTELEQAEFVMPQEMCYPGLDDIPVPALLYLPPGTRKNAPALIEIHGGPDWHFTFHWNPFMTHAASRGWIVLAPNYRGSTGYGHAWLTANRYKMGSIDTADCTAGQLFLVEQGWADPRRVAVSGRSHGGYLTMMCLTHFPELWAAGSAVVPFLNWFTAHKNSREDLRHWDIENFGHPDENQELWYTHSPYFFLERVQAPVQLICSKNDPRCPSSESEAARDRLQELGKEVDFILYQDEGHILLHIENIIDAETRRVDFLAKALERT